MDTMHIPYTKVLFNLIETDYGDWLDTAHISLVMEITSDNINNTQPILPELIQHK